ncbi:hypothetical protein BB560_001537 [Smittium megazygosporum]|uniref:Mitochondrial DNA polymerase catalytic subunit n=1 Tax=Smittium megazygosporum TaxID=133381 RepID=A0A2T9ZHA0_9FUNG|nr:hypothetical protein BB560_001537 [Smittium megazygosporum]
MLSLRKCQNILNRRLWVSDFQTTNCLFKHKHVRTPLLAIFSKGYQTTNEVGIQLLPTDLHNSVFGSAENGSFDKSTILNDSNDSDMLLDQKIKKAIETISKHHLQNHGLDPNSTTNYDKRFDDLSFELPQLLGHDIDSHFRAISSLHYKKYRDLADKASVFSKIPVFPKTKDLLLKSGWVKYVYNNDKSTFDTKQVDGISEDTIFFDVETMPTEGNVPIIASAMSLSSWYVWLSPYILNESQIPLHLVPISSPQSTNSRPKKRKSSKKSGKNDLNFESSFEKNKVIIGHNVGFDRSMIFDEYKFEESTFGYIDTMSLHIASHGLGSQQRILFKKVKKIEDNNLDYDLEFYEKDLIKNFYSVSCSNGLQALAKYYLNMDLDKEIRNDLVKSTKTEIQADLSSFISYCIKDVYITALLYKKLFKFFTAQCPHPASFAGMLIMSSGFLPVVPEKWNDFIERSEKLIHEKKQIIERRLIEIAMEQSNAKNPHEDRWLRQLDWGKSYIKYKKPPKSAHPAADGTPEMIKKYSVKYLRKIEQNPALEDKPNWLLELWDDKEKKFNISTKLRIAPYLLKVTWNGFPIVHIKDHGWVYEVPKEFFDASDNSESNGSVQSNFEKEIDSPDDAPADTDPGSQPLIDFNSYSYFKVPHKNGQEFNVGNVFSKDFAHAIDSGVLKSPSGIEKDAIELATLGSYWIGNRDRIKSQTVIPVDKTLRPSSAGKQSKNLKTDSTAIKAQETIESSFGIILPQTVPMGTITRRSVEGTWATATNAKKNRIGSELKTLIEAPPGYKIVGADVDSEEMWISSLFGDSQFGFHGATAIGYMCLQGSKSSGNDVHSVTAKILNISRDKAKVFNYSRIYGAGISHAEMLLLQADPTLTEKAARALVSKLYAKTKGSRAKFTGTLEPYGISDSFNRFWYGGSESYMFNILESVSKNEESRTPILGCGIAAGLQQKNIDSMFITSRVNWVVQSSGVDYLHLLLVSMDYLIRKYSIDARFMVSIHDEVRYICTEKDAYRCALALQISNLWVRSMFSFKVGIKNLPASVAFFSAVDVDYILRKETNLDCVTPSNSVPLEHGESLDIFQVVNKTKGILSPTKGDIEAPKTLLIDDPDFEALELKATENMDVAKTPNKKETNEKGQSDNKTGHADFDDYRLKPSLILKLRLQMSNSNMELHKIIQNVEREKKLSQYNRIEV